MSETSPVSRFQLALFIVGAWLGSHLVLIAGHVALVFLYSLAIAPGLTNAEYSAFAERSGPWFSIVVGGPVFYVVGRFLRRRLGGFARKAALVVWALYSLTDLTIVLLVSGLLAPLLAAQWIASQSIKLVAVLVSTRTKEGSSLGGGSGSRA